MQEKENFTFQGILTAQEKTIDMLQWVKHAAKKELHVLGDIDCIERKVSPGKMG